ncbi:hypothetical protein BC827DRAFT_1222196 [Russula dissimulans]|nr:hypothetical protein BC827DRAFT_1222196 [Russula dissimulans]
MQGVILNLDHPQLEEHPRRSLCDILQSPSLITPHRKTSTNKSRPNSAGHGIPSPENSSCAALNRQGSPLGSQSCALAGHAISIDKENVSPFFLDSSGFPKAVQELASTPLQPAPAAVVRPNELHSITPLGLPPIQTHLFMTLRGEPICFDLQTLDADPHLIIELLSATSSDRDKWMIVGASYRRKGNVHAALTVLTTMVKVLNDLGLRKCDMKPAFLMLSSCHVELWRQTRAADGSETETSAAHLDKSCRWLQLVYDQGDPETTSDNSSEVLGTLSPVDTTPRSAHGVPSAQDNKSQRTDIERDLQVLRDRQALHVEELSRTREAKRRLEDEAENERITRRRLERTLRELQTKLVKAQRRADDAHALVRVEAHTRRRCEQVIADERAKRRALEEHLKRQAQGARPLLEELAGLFQGPGTLVRDVAFGGPPPEASPRR